jgi:hypothetical protein
MTIVRAIVSEAAALGDKSSYEMDVAQTSVFEILPQQGAPASLGSISWIVLYSWESVYLIYE